LRVAGWLAEKFGDRLALVAPKLIRDGHHGTEVERSQNASTRHVLQRLAAGRTTVGRTLVTRRAAPLIDRLA
jgi:hypothetical protein